MAHHQFLHGLLSPLLLQVPPFVSIIISLPRRLVGLTCSPAIPASSGYTAIGLGIFSVISVFIKVCFLVFTTRLAMLKFLINQHFWIPKKYWGYVPNWVHAFPLNFIAS